MKDPLLYSTEITIPLILEKVASVTEISVSDFNVPNHYPLSRKRELTTARQLSMAISKKYTKKSLSAIGWLHAGRDHATVLHACKTIDNLIDTHDPFVTDSFTKLDNIFRKIKEDTENRKRNAEPIFAEVNEELSNINKTLQD
jgi:chromosomal replication initiation ATPase DnaA